MPLKQKYFVPFIVAVFVFAAILIIIISLANRSGKEETFRQNVYQMETLRSFPLITEISGDTIRIQQFSDNFIVLNFWATWSEYSKDMHRRLETIRSHTGGEVVVIAASVRDADSEIKKHLNKHERPFTYVEGTALYDSLAVPGVPSNIIFGPDGSVLNIQVGFDKNLSFDVLPVAAQLDSSKKNVD